ncbi:MAG TPA: hypothetical protein VF215_10155 [Thermoanaerobaculia bacterium]
MRSRPTLTALLVLFGTIGCGELKTPTSPVGGPQPPDPTATFTRVQAEVFTPSCATIACHDPLGQQSQMVLTAGRAYANTVGVSSIEMPSLQRIAPNDPANSYLYRKITGAGITGDRMPLQQPPLSDAQIALVRNWILRGAPND